MPGHSHFLYPVCRAGSTIPRTMSLAGNGRADPDMDDDAVIVRQNRNVNRSMEHWDRLSTSILKQGYWNRIGNLTRSFDSLPPDIEAMFNEIEERNPVRLNADQRLIYYAEFTRTALGSTTLHFRDVESLIARKNPEDQLPTKQ